MRDSSHELSRYSFSSNGTVYLRDWSRKMPSQAFEDALYVSRWRKSFYLDDPDCEPLPDERIAAIISENDLLLNRYVVIVTAKGYVTRYPSRLIIAQETCFYSCLLDSDYVLAVCLTSGSDELVFCSAAGKIFRLSERLIPVSQVIGEAGFSLLTNIVCLSRKEDRIQFVTKAEPWQSIVVLTERGYGKRMPVSSIVQIQSAKDLTPFLHCGAFARDIRLTNTTGTKFSGGAFDIQDAVLYITVEGSSGCVPVMDIPSGDAPSAMPLVPIAAIAKNDSVIYVGCQLRIPATEGA